MSSTSNLYQFYLKKYFEIPNEIKNDIIYCHRALKGHIKVYDFVEGNSGFFKGEIGLKRKKWALEELADGIKSINCDLQCLVLRVRTITDEFHQMLKSHGIIVDKDATNEFIQRDVVPQVHGDNADISPVKVMERSTEHLLMKKYVFDFVPEEIFDSVEEDFVAKKNKTKKDNNAAQKSQLKPISQCSVIAPDAGLPFVPKVDIKEEPILPRIRVAEFARMSFQEADAEPTPRSTTKPPKLSAVPPKTADVKNRATRGAAAGAADDSNQERELAVSQGFWKEEPVETRTRAEEYGQESFLRTLGLCTYAEYSQMLQRRSKRKRRNVNYGERANFHHGCLDRSSSCREEKEVRKKQRHRQKLRGHHFALKPSNRFYYSSLNSNGSRNNSCSPNEKIKCNECGKTGTPRMLRCFKCKSSYHLACHHTEDGSIRTAINKPHYLMCPSCKRLECTLLQAKDNIVSLENSAKQLELRKAQEIEGSTSVAAQNMEYKVMLTKFFDCLNTL